MDDWEDWDDAHPPRPPAERPRRQSPWLGVPWWALLTPPVIVLAVVLALLLR